MKILILSDDFPPLSFGGAGIAAYRLAKELQNRGHDVRVFSTTQNKDQSTEITYNNLPIIFNYCIYNHYFSGWLGLYNPLILKKLKAALLSFKPDVVHAHNVHYYISYASLHLAKKYCDQVFLTAHDTNIFYPDKFYEYIDFNDKKVHTDFNYKLTWLVKLKLIKKTFNPFRLMIVKYYLKSVNKIFAVSNSLQEALNQNGIKNIKTIYNGVVVDENIDADSGIIFRNKFNIPLDKKIVLMAGRFNTLKGGKLLLLYIEELKKTRNDFIIIFVGQKNNLTDSILAQTTKQNWHDYLLFTDWLEPVEMASAYKSSALVITPSIYLDVFNLTNIEAMKYKKPVVGTCFGGTAEIVVDGVTGYVINPYDIKITVKRIAGLLADSDKSANFGLAGYNRVFNYFSLKKQVDKMLEYYTES